MVDNKSNYDSFDVFNELKKLAADEPKEFGAFSEPLAQYGLAQGNLDQSGKNISGSYSQGYSDLMKNTAQQEMQAINQSLGNNANPFAIQQVKTDTANKQANTLLDIRRRLTQDKSALNLQKQQSAESISNALSNEDLLLKGLNRIRDKEADRRGDLKEEFNQTGLQKTILNWLQQMVTPYWSPENAKAFQSKFLKEFNNPW